MWSYIFNIALLIVSIYALVEGSELFITQSSNLARKYHIPEFLIGITIVAFGTSMPEFIISLVAAFEGNIAITATNVIGSSIANIGFILSITAMFGAIKIDKNNLTFDIPLSALSVVVFLAIVFLFHGQINWIAGIILIIVFATYFTMVYLRERNTNTVAESKHHGKVSIAMLILSIVLIGFGGKYSVDSAINLASFLHISDGFAGFTILAVGSSLPELLVSIMALKKHKYGLSLGNIIGSNFFNLFFIIGVSSFVLTLPFSSYIYELIILLFYNIALIVAAFIGKKYYISRREGLFILISYLVLIIYLYYR